MAWHIARFWDRLNLIARLLLAVVLSLIIALIGAAYQTAHETAVAVQHELVAEHQQEMDWLESIVASAIIADEADPDPDPLRLKAALEGLKQGPEVVHVGFRDTSDSVSFSHDTPVPLQAPLWFSRWCGLEEVRANRAVVIGGQYFGVLTLILSPNDAINRAWGHYLRQMQVLSLCFLLVWLSMGWVIRQGLLPLHALAKASEALGRGDLTTRLKVHGSPELRTSLSNFNQMALRIETARDEIGASEKRFRALIEQAPDAIVVYDLDLERIVDANASAEMLFGRSRGELLQTRPQSLYAPEQPDQLKSGEGFPESAKKEMSGEKAISERVIRAADGRDRICVVHEVGLPDEPGRLIRASFIDITERKLAEEALRQSEARHRMILDTAMDGFWMVDTQGRLLEVNQTYSQMSGYSVQELLTMRIADLEAVQIQEEIAARIQTLIERREDRFETRHRRKDGTLFDVEVSVQHRPDEGGRFVAFLRDITEQKRMEEEREKLQNKLTQAQKMESVGTLAGGVAHDYNNMLGVILGYADMALEKLNPDDSLRDDLREIRKAAIRSMEVTRQLLAFARKQTIAPRVIDLNEMVEGMLKMLRPLIGENIHLSWLPESGLWPVKMDPSQLDQILANLCINARDAIAGVGKITIETKKIAFDKTYCLEHPGSLSGEFVLLTVSDNGCGMDKETMARIFDPFFTTKGVGRGTGLGLATVYGIVKQNNGFINVYSELDYGTTFKIYLPRHQGDAEPTHAERLAETAQRGQETILLVEDEPSLLALSTLMLERLGYRVMAAGSPGEAIRLAEEHPGEIHLLMTDVVMPEMNGRDLAEKMRCLYPRLKCLFTSGYTADVIAHHGVLDAGVYFIPKPFSRKELAAKIREVLGQTD